MPYPAHKPPELDHLRDATAALHAATSACGEAYRLWSHEGRDESTPRTRMALEEAERDVLLAYERLRAVRLALDPAELDDEAPADVKSWGAH